MEGGEVLDEVLVVVVYLGGAGVPTWVETPPLRLDVGSADRCAEPWHVGVGAVRKPLLQQGFTAIGCLDRLAPVQAHDVGEQFDLLGEEVPVGPVDLAVEMPGVDEENLVLTLGALLGPVEEPQRDREGDCVEEVGPDGHHHVDRARLHELAADLPRSGRRRPLSWPSRTRPDRCSLRAE